MNIKDNIEASLLDAEHIEALAVMIQEHFTIQLTGNKVEDLFLFKRYFNEYSTLLSILLEKNRHLQQCLADALKNDKK